MFLRDIYKNVLSIENADNNRSNLFKELINISEGKNPIEKFSFLETAIILFEARETVLNSFKSNMFS